MKKNLKIFSTLLVLGMLVQAMPLFAEPSPKVQVEASMSDLISTSVPVKNLSNLDSDYMNSDNPLLPTDCTGGANE